MHFDSTISLGNVITGVLLIVTAILVWRDMDWRVKNLETWRVEHMVDSDARDELLKKMDRVLAHVRWQTEFMAGRRNKPPDVGSGDD